MIPIIITLAVLAAIAVTGKSLPALLLSTVADTIHLLGKTLEEWRENIKHYIQTPEPPNIIRYIMSSAFTIGSITWSCVDALLMAMSLQIIIPENTLKMFSTGLRPVDYFVGHHLYSVISIVVVLMLTVLIHQVLSYLSQRYPNDIEGIISMAVIAAVICMIVLLAFMRLYSAKMLLEMSRAIESHNYNISSELARNSGILSTVFFIIGILCAGLCAYLGFNQMLHQSAQIGACIFLVPITVLWFGFIILSKTIEGVKIIISVPISILDAIIKFFRWLFRKKPPSGPGSFAPIIILISVSLFLSGCAPSAKPRLVIAVIDLSASFIPERENVLIEMNELIDCIEAEDQLYVLFIAENSFKDKRIIYLGAKDNTNIQDNLQYLKAKDLLKKDITKVLNKALSKRTDVFGALQRAQSLFNERGNGCDKYLIVFSDLSDDINTKKTTLELDSVNVLVLFAGSDKNNYTSVQAQLECWLQIFQNSNTAFVTILNHDLSLSSDFTKYFNEREVPCQKHLK